MDNNIIKYLQIGVFALPFYGTVILTAILLKRELDNARKYSLFWLIFIILFSGIFIYLVLIGSKFTFNQALLSLLISNGWTTYFILKKKENK